MTDIQEKDFIVKKKKKEGGSMFEIGKKKTNLSKMHIFGTVSYAYIQGIKNLNNECE